MHIQVIFSLLSCAIITATSDEYSPPVWRIVNGVEATTRYQFMVSLQTLGEIKDVHGNGTGTYKYFHRCGGSIIQNDCIVTAAHCVVNNTYNKFSVFVGSNDLDDPSGQRYFLRNFTIHSNYSTANDIAVLRLNQSMSFSDRIGPIGQSKDFIGGGVSLRLIGWGKTEQRKPAPLPRKLQEANTTSLTDEKCNENELYKPTEHDICTQQTPIGANSGDSGGPLFLVRENAEYILVGTVSRGYYISAYRTMPDIFVRTSWYVDWINEQCNQP